MAISALRQLLVRHISTLGKIQDDYYALLNELGRRCSCIAFFIDRSRGSSFSHNHNKHPLDEGQNVTSL